MGTVYALAHIWLVLDKDRNPIDAFADEAGAIEAAHMQDGIAERWPINSGPRNKAWTKAIAVSKRLAKERSNGANHD